MSTRHDNYRIVEMISKKSIDARVEEMARQIQETYIDADPLVMVGLLRGSFVFMADLARELTLPVTVDFIEASSYGSDTQSSGEVRILKDLRSPIEGKDVLIVEDIIDTGTTLRHVTNLLKARKPKRLHVCTLLDKPARRRVEMKSDWSGFEIPDEFVIGYGLDYDERNRNLPYVGRVEFIEDA